MDQKSFEKLKRDVIVETSEEASDSKLPGGFLIICLN